MVSRVNQINFVLKDRESRLPSTMLANLTD
jgi:hypothetical protein